MEKGHNVDPLDSLSVPFVVPSVVNLHIWAKQTSSSHYLHIFSAACTPTRPRSTSQQCNSGYYKAGATRFAALSHPVFRLPLQPIRYSSAIYLFSVYCKYSTIIQFGRVYLAHQSDGAVVSNLEWEKLAEVGACGGQRQERSLKINHLWTWIAWTLPTCCLLSSFDCFVSRMLPYTSQIRR